MRVSNAVLLVLAAGGMFVGAAGISLLGTPQSVDLRLEPRAVDYRDSVTEGESPVFPFMLTNPAAESLTVLRIATTCLCATVEADSLPFPIAPGKPHTFRVRVDSTARSGLMKTGVTVTYQRETGELGTQSAEIGLKVRPAWRVNPPTLQLHDLDPGVEARATIELYDGFPDPGIALKHIAVSSPEYLAVTVIEKAAPHGNAQTVEATVDGIQYRRRALIELSLTPRNEQGLQQEFVMLYPDRPSQTVLSIPITYTLRKPALSLKPDQILVVNSVGGGVVKRTIRCTTRISNAASLVVVNSPTHILTELVRRSSDTVDLLLNITVSDAPAESIVLLGLGSSRFEVPIRILNASIK